MTSSLKSNERDNATPHVTTHYAMLDGLRGIAAIAVLFGHIFSLLHKEQPLPQAFLAVDFFFMLSGFVVAKAYEKKLTTTMTFSEFMKIRLVRLYPLIFISVLLGTLTIAVRMLATHTLVLGDLLLALISALLLLPTKVLFSLYPGMIYPINLPEWSLFFELTVNAVYAPIARKLTTKALALIVLFSGTAIIVMAFLNNGLSVGFEAQNFLLGFIRVIFPFFLGVLLFRAHSIRKVNSYTGLLLAIIFAVVLFMPKQRGWLYDVIAVGVIFPLIIYFGAMCKEQGIIRRFAIWLGELSYPLYIAHHPIVRIVANGMDRLHLHPPPLMLVGICSLVSVLASIALLLFWDRPVRKYLSSRFIHGKYQVRA